jgi:hypothetical protein
MRAVVLLVVGAIGAGTAPIAAAVPAPWKNCAAVNARYPHGVGKVGAHDSTAGEPVTTFKRSNRLYKVAMSNNRGLRPAST